MINQTRGGRINRINPLIQKIISSALLRSSDPILNKATITHVSTSPDLKKSMVFVSTLDGNEGSLKNSLEKNRIKIQKVLGREMTTRNVPKIIFDVKCSQALEDMIKKYKGEPVMWKTGHSLIKEKMRKTKALLAGEMSGHVFFADNYYGYDDALYASVRLLKILTEKNK